MVQPCDICLRQLCCPALSDLRQGEVVESVPVKRNGVRLSLRLDMLCQKYLGYVGDAESRALLLPVGSGIFTVGGCA